MANPEIHSLEELRAAGNPNYLRIAQRRNAVWRAGDLVNKAVPHTFAPVTSPIRTDSAYAEYGVGVISQARPNMEHYPLVTQLIPFQPGERSVLPLLAAYPEVTFGYALDKRFCYTPGPLEPKRYNSEWQLSIPRLHPGGEMAEQDLANTLRQMSREPFPRFSSLELNPRDFLRLVNLRLLELQRNQHSGHYRPNPDIVVIEILNTPPPNNFEAAVGLTFDGRLVTIPEYRTVRRDYSGHYRPVHPNSGAYRPTPAQREAIQHQNPHYINHPNSHHMGDHRFR
jgi:hypothetical protein